jgi:hypothetical protein
MRWHETHVETIKSQISVEDLEDLFLTQTMSPYWLSERLMDLTMIQYKPRERLREYNTRFSEAVGDCRRDVYSDKPGDLWLRDIYLAKLPDAVRTKLPKKQAMDYANLHKLLETTAKVHPEAVVAYQVKHVRCGMCQKELYCSTNHTAPTNYRKRSRSRSPQGEKYSDNGRKREKNNENPLKDKNTRPEGKDWNWCDKHHAWGRHEAAKCTLEYGGKPQNKNLEVVKSAEQQEIDDIEAFFEPANFAEWSSQALDSTPSLRTTVVAIK